MLSRVLRAVSSGVSVEEASGRSVGLGRLVCELTSLFENFCVRFCYLRDAHVPAFRVRVGPLFASAFEIGLLFIALVQIGSYVRSPPLFVTFISQTHAPFDTTST
ncbi:hypothetical protein VPH35_088672 [Triticum aestivum]